MLQSVYSSNYRSETQWYSVRSLYISEPDKYIKCTCFVLADHSSLMMNILIMKISYIYGQRWYKSRAPEGRGYMLRITNPLSKADTSKKIARFGREIERTSSPR